MTILSIDSTDRDSIIAAIKAEVATPESMAAWLYSLSDGYAYAVCEDGVLILEPDTWQADDGHAQIENKDSTAQDAAEEYVSSGEWGNEGGSVSVHVRRDGIDSDGDDVEVDSECIEVGIPQDHGALIAEAVGRDCGCGTDPDDHDWTSEGERGCKENPGVWSTGGTSMHFSAHCRRCGLHRTEHHVGRQHNPGEGDTTSYRMLDADEIEWHRENGSMTEIEETADAD